MEGIGRDKHNGKFVHGSVGHGGRIGGRYAIGCLFVAAILIASVLAQAIIVGAPPRSANSGGGGDPRPLQEYILLPISTFFASLICTGNEYTGFLLVASPEDTGVFWTSISMLNSPYNGEAGVEHITSTNTKLMLGWFGFISESAEGVVLTRANGAIGANFILAEWTLYSIYCFHAILPIEWDTGWDTAWVTDWEPLGYKNIVFDDLMPEGTKSHEDAPNYYYRDGYYSHFFDVSYDSMRAVLDTTGASGENTIVVRGLSGEFLKMAVSARFPVSGIDLPGFASVSYQSGVQEEDKYYYSFYPDGIWWMDYLAADNMLRSFNFIDPPPPSDPPEPPPDDDDEGRPKPPDCVWVSPWNGSHFVNDNNMLSLSSTRNYSSNFSLTDNYVLRRQLVGEEGLYTLRLREFAEQRNAIDKVRLWAIYHDQSSSVTSDGDGNILSFSPMTASAFEARNSTGADILSLVSAPGDGYAYWAAEDDDYVVLSFNKGYASPVGRLMMRSQMFYPPIKKPRPIHVGDGETMQHVGDIQPRANWHIDGLDIGDYLPPSEPTFVVNITLPMGHRLDYVGFDESMEPFVDVIELPLSRAIDHSSVEITNELLTSDRDYSYLVPSENFTLEFDGGGLPSPGPGIEVDYLISLEGFYNPNTDFLPGEEGRILLEYEDGDVILTPSVADYDDYLNVTWMLDESTSAYVSDILRLDGLEPGEHSIYAFVNFATHQILLYTRFEIPDNNI